MANKLLIFSNSPFLQTGYGTQTALFAKLAKNDGFDVVIFGFAGHRGVVMQQDGIDIFPGSLEHYGGDMFQAHIQFHQPDVTVALFDAWVYQPDQLAGVTLWAPVDHDPIPPLVADRLRHASAVWAMSRHGERAMRAVGLDPSYVPHAVDTTVYRPLTDAERQHEREKRGLKPGQFFAVMVAANKGYPSRKSFPEVFKAWAAFTRTHPDAVLYIHTLFTEAWAGLDLAQLATFYGISPANLRFVDPYPLLNGFYGAEHLNRLYNAADVLLSPSMGEGFGVCVIDAQAAGCPVIVSDFTAQSELSGPGYRVPIYDDDRVYTSQGSEQARPRPSEIVRALEWAYDSRGNAQLRAESRAFALDYDMQRVWTCYMKPALLERKLTAKKEERQERFPQIS